MADTITVTANWATGNLSNSIISRQYDNNRYRVEFTGYPEDGTENLIFYLLVFMRTEENPRGVILPPVQLSSDQWLISNYFTQLSQQIRFQLCVQNEAGTFEAHSPIFKGTIVDSLDHVGEEIDIDTSALFDAYREYINQLIIAAGAVVIDTALDATSENPVQNKAVAAEFTAVNGRLQQYSEEVGNIGNEVYADDIALTANTITNSFHMDEHGAFVGDTLCMIDKYDVVAGTLLHIFAEKESDGVWCFRDAIESSSNVVGLVNTTGGDSYEVVPEGAVYLFVSKLKTNTTNSVHTVKSIVAENTNAVTRNMADIDRISTALSAKYQYIDNTQWVVDKYYSGAGIMRTAADTGYAAYPTLVIPAGTYYYQRIAPSMTYATSATQESYKPFSSFSGTVTFEEETTLYITAQKNFDSQLTMFATGPIPSEYACGNYGYAKIRDIFTGCKIVDISGNGDYTNVQDAIDACQDLDNYNVQTGVHETIIVFPGTYPRFTMRRNGAGNVHRRNISIIGLDRQKCIIKEDGGLYKAPAAEIRTDGTIRNLTFITTHDAGDPETTESKDAYAVHIDFGWCNTVYENCTFISCCNAAVGIGLQQDSNLIFRNCLFHTYADRSVWGGTSPYGIYVHNYRDNGTVNQHITLIDCECITENGQYGGVFQILSNTGDSEQYATLIRNLFWGVNGNAVNIFAGWDTTMSYGNSVTI